MGRGSHVPAGGRFRPRAVRNRVLPGRRVGTRARGEPPRLLRVRRLRGRALPAGDGRGTRTPAIRERVGDVASRGIVPMVIGGDHIDHLAVCDRCCRGLSPWQRRDRAFRCAPRIPPQAPGGTCIHTARPMRRLIDQARSRGRNLSRSDCAAYWPPKDVFDWNARAGNALAPQWASSATAVWFRSIDEAIAEAARRPGTHLPLGRYRRPRPGLRTRDRDARTGRDATGRPPPSHTPGRVAYPRCGHVDLVEVSASL